MIANFLTDATVEKVFAIMGALVACYIVARIIHPKVRYMP